MFVVSYILLCFIMYKCTWLCLLDCIHMLQLLNVKRLNHKLFDLQYSTRQQVSSRFLPASFQARYYCHGHGGRVECSLFTIFMRLPLHHPNLIKISLFEALREFYYKHKTSSSSYIALSKLYLIFYLYDKRASATCIWKGERKGLK